MRGEIVSIAVACTIACGSESANESNGSTSSSSSSSSGGSSSGTTSGNSVEAGGGCKIEAIGFNAGNMVQSLARASEGDGGVKWTDVDNAKALDGAFAKVVLAAGQESEELRISGFSFKLPVGSVFQGVDVRLDRQAPEGGIVDGAIALVGVKNQTAKGKFIATAWPSTIVGTHHYAQATDTWGMDLNPPDVETVSFGVGIWVKRDPSSTGPANATALVDAMQIRVHFCPP